MIINFENQKALKEKSLNKRRYSIEERIRRLVSNELIRLAKQDNSLASVTIVRVFMAKDLRKADVYVRMELLSNSSENNKTNKIDCLKKYESAVRNCVASNLGTRICPQINFLPEIESTNNLLKSSLNSVLNEAVGPIVVTGRRVSEDDL